MKRHIKTWLLTVTSISILILSGIGSRPTLESCDDCLSCKAVKKLYNGTYGYWTTECVLKGEVKARMEAYHPILTPISQTAMLWVVPFFLYYLYWCVKNIKSGKTPLDFLNEIFEGKDELIDPNDFEEIK